MLRGWIAIVTGGRRARSAGADEVAAKDAVAVELLAQACGAARVLAHVLSGNAVCQARAQSPNAAPEDVARASPGPHPPRTP